MGREQRRAERKRREADYDKCEAKKG
jgi:hypothetical protein